ncbi:MAG: hypothetical protein IKL10_04635 [Clostridia bacterium]|nr:hypothetical protein [Clostridia bacterium]
MSNEIKTATTTEATTQNRWKSWALWLSVLGAVGVILNATGVFEKIGLTSETWETVINAVGSILIGFGILNNPTNKSGF